MVTDLGKTPGVVDYTRLANEMRDLAAQAKSREAREQLNVLAVQYEHLAERVINKKSAHLDADLDAVTNART